MTSESPRALAADTARLRAILETAVDGIITIGADGIIQSANPAVSRIFGYATEELIGSNVSILMPSPDRDRHDGYLQHYLATGDTKIIGVGREVTGQRKDGSTFPIYLAVSHAAVHGKDLFTGIVRDITDMKRLENSLREANAAKTDFLSSMSHELRTPLNAILGFGQLMMDDSNRSLDDDHRTYMENILDAGSHLLSLVDDVLDLAKIESGTIDVALKDLDICDIIEECVPLIESIGEKRSISLRNASTSKSLPAVRADAIRSKQILLNLLSNAVKYSNENSEVTLDVSDTGTGIRVTISNTGPGIPLDRQKEVFERFNRLDFSRSNVGGSGIGLAISKQLAEMMGGQIGFESIPNEKTSFWLDLRYAAGSAKNASRQSVGANNAFKVLYIEDNPSNLQLMEHVINHIGGFSMISAHSVDWALDIIDLWDPDAILMDTKENACDEAMCEVCARAQRNDIPIVVISAAPDEQPTCAAAQHYHRVSRPIRPTDIDTVLRHAVGG